MIRFVDKFCWDRKKYQEVPFEAWNCLDTETGKLMSDCVIQGEDYYVYHNGQDTDRYKRVIALSFVDICQTDKEDDLSKYGFKLIGQKLNGLNWWMRK